MLHIPQPQLPSELRRAATGALSGFAATIPMTVFMLLAHQVLPRWQQYPLPPQRITDRLAERAGLRKHMDRRELLGTALASHLGYGTAAGSMFGLTLGRLWKNPFAGMTYGIVLWAVGYLGYLPAFDILPPSTREPKGRVALMVAAHLIWGATAGMMQGLPGHKPERPRPAKVGPTARPL